MRRNQFNRLTSCNIPDLSNQEYPCKVSFKNITCQLNFGCSSQPYIFFLNMTVVGFVSDFKYNWPWALFMTWNYKRYELTLITKLLEYTTGIRIEILYRNNHYPRIEDVESNPLSRESNLARRIFDGSRCRAAAEHLIKRSWVQILPRAGLLYSPSLSRVSSNSSSGEV